ncbi:MAG TPA: shikimate dehydrogenase [Dehalococcoidia bacterium]|nr:shikimate dehydrogenase [Chloroflexota bacterium]MDP5876057.1 shikimate dehydrogenase [Dehalococcoidia bacterium]MDP6273677.1 shikimate dehydrogenase [Dehalococcoidia bacterium]MDP7160643.1 shikimate dehydrogenase [Dehalococcoidia bacterium]MDP7213689.1 shikimate dehydrogenase [Dehalococcoidia bacterium]
MTKRLGIFGYPLHHSMSPLFQQAALDALGIDAKFEGWPTKPEDFAAAVEGLRSDDCLGCCITQPHKEAALELVDELDPAAEAIGAINTIVSTTGRLKGYNTDAPGFIRGLRESVGFDPDGKSALVLGAGGAARGIVYALREAGVSRMAIANRTEERAQALARDMSRTRFRPDAMSLHIDQLANFAPYADLIVNATSMGMRGGEADEESPIQPELISGNAVCYDAVYVPPVTPFLEVAEEAGARVAGGLSMLIYQGAEGFKLWTGQDAPVAVMFDAIPPTMRGD